MQTTVITLAKENMKFSAGHFTILSATERERLHGHNYRVAAQVTAVVDEKLGLSFDYRAYKNKLYELCRSLNEYFLLPGKSPYLAITDTGGKLDAEFAGEVIPFLTKDVKVLPLKNISVEELSHWFVEQLSCDKAELAKLKIQKIEVKVFSGPGQAAATSFSSQT